MQTYTEKRRNGNKDAAVSEKPRIPSVRDALSSPDTRKLDLPEQVREQMQSAFSVDLSDVTIFESPLIKSEGANAIAKGNMMGFAPGKFRPESTTGQALIGHELSHIMHQAQGQHGAPGVDGVLSDTSLEAQADSEGLSAALGGSVYSGETITPAGTDSAPIQADKDKPEKTQYESEKLAHHNATQQQALVTRHNAGLSRPAAINSDAVVSKLTNLKKYMAEDTRSAGDAAFDTFAPGVFHQMQSSDAFRKGTSDIHDAAAAKGAPLSPQEASTKMLLSAFRETSEQNSIMNGFGQGMASGDTVQSMVGLQNSTFGDRAMAAEAEKERRAEESRRALAEFEAKKARGEIPANTPTPDFTGSKTGSRVKGNEAANPEFTRQIAEMVKADPGLMKYLRGLQGTMAGGMDGDVAGANTAALSSFMLGVINPLLFDKGATSTDMRTKKAMVMATQSLQNAVNETSIKAYFDPKYLDTITDPEEKQRVAAGAQSFGHLYNTLGATKDEMTTPAAGYAGPDFVAERKKDIAFSPTAVQFMDANSIGMSKSTPSAQKRHVIRGMNSYAEADDVSAPLPQGVDQYRRDVAIPAEPAKPKTLSMAPGYKWQPPTTSATLPAADPLRSLRPHQPAVPPQPVAAPPVQWTAPRGRSTGARSSVQLGSRSPSPSPARVPSPVPSPAPEPVASSTQQGNPGPGLDGRPVTPLRPSTIQRRMNRRAGVFKPVGPIEL